MMVLVSYDVSTINAAGRRRLHAERGNWHEFAAAITALLEAKPWPATT